MFIKNNFIDKIYKKALERVLFSSLSIPWRVSLFNNMGFYMGYNLFTNNIIIFLY
jgi:hypothetical protein